MITIHLKVEVDPTPETLLCIKFTTDNGQYPT
jgi:hypothetical protein